MNYSKRRRIPLPDDLIPKEYIGERFGVMLVFIKGSTQEVIDRKVKKIREFCNTLRNEEKDDIVVST